MARAATSPELALFRTPGQWSRYRAAIYSPTTVYTARINQTFSSLDKVLEFDYDTGSGTLADALPDMTVYIGSTAGAWDKGIVRLRSIDASKVYIGETSDIRFSNNDYITIVDDFGLWARPVLISSGVVYMDGGIEYDDQHTNFLPLIRGGGDRVAELVSSTVSLSFNFPATVPGSSVSSRSTSAPGADSITGGTTQTPSITWDSVGWKKVYHTVTAANGKSFFIVRDVFIWDSTNLPEPVEINENPRGDTEAGGWSVGLTLYDSASLSLVRDRAKVLLFTEDHYGATASQIGPVSGCENIAFAGWISKESIDWKSQGGAVSFSAHGPHYWMQKIPAWPDGVEFTTGTPDKWTEIKNLTVDLGLVHHFLMWRTTAPRILDIFPTGDSRYTKEVSSLAGDLWSQIREMAFDQIFARALTNRIGQLFIEIHPQLIPEASRTHPTVLALLERDLEEGIPLERVITDEASIVDLSGVNINGAGKATAFFSLSPGHSHSHYGSPVVVNRLLLSSQAQANQLAGLYRGWLNNQYPSIPLKLSANNRLIDICPLQKCAITIASGDTIRGISESLGLIPLSIEEVFDPATGYAHQEVNFEAETFEDLSTIGDFPSSGNVSTPPIPRFPPLPPIEVITPGTGTGPTLEGDPQRVIIHDRSAGLLYSGNFDESSPTWQAVNAGLESYPYDEINTIFVDQEGGIYVALREYDYPGGGHAKDLFIAYAPSIGASFEIIEDLTSIRAKHSGTVVAISGIFLDRLTGTLGYILVGDSSDAKLYIGSGTSFNSGSVITGYQNAAPSFAASLSFGAEAWLITGPTGAFVHAGWFRMNSAGTSLSASGDMPVSTLYEHVRVGSSDKCYHHSGDDFIYSTGNAASFSASLDNDINTGFYLDNRVALDPTGVFIMADGDGSAHKTRSSDGGVSFSGIPTLPTGNHVFGYAGGVGVESRWIVGSGIIRSSSDFGDTWDERGGNILTLAPIPNIDVVKAIGF